MTEVAMEQAANSLLWRKIHDPKSVTPRAAKKGGMSNEAEISDQKRESRAPPSVFPSKYGQLPDIKSPQPRLDNQLVPLKSDAYKSSQGRFGYDYKSGNMGDVEEKVRQLELRISVSEKSNRALLDEVLRLQADLRNATKRSEDIIREERDARYSLEQAMKISHEIIQQLSSRIKETEDKIEDEKANLSTLVNHTRSVEKSVIGSQKDLQSNKESQTHRLSELRSELQETKQAKNELERVAFALGEELRSIKNKLENQQMEFATVTTDLRNRAKKLEEDNRMHLDAMRKQSDLHNMSDVQTTQLRGQVENRLAELRDVLMELRSRQETEQTERRNLEKQLQQNVSELYGAIGEQTRKREEGLHTVDMVLREKDHAAQSEKMAITSKLSDTVEDVNKRLLAKEIKLREEIQAKFLQLEKLVQREQQTRQDYEKSSKEDQERRWHSLKQVLEDELRAVKENLHNERTRSKETAGKLDDAITIVEKQLQENKKQMDKVLAAEIKSRKLHEHSTTEKIHSVNEKLQIATSTLQQAIGGLTQQMSANNEKVRREVKSMMTEQQQAGTRAVTDLDTRVMQMKQRMINMEDMMDAKVASAASGVSERLQERIDTMTKWQEQTGDTLRELGRSVQTLPQEVYSLEEKQKLLKADLDTRVSLESDARSKEIELLRQELFNLKTRMDVQPKPASMNDLEAMNMGVRKLADSIQTVKTVLGMKIQSEQKLRTEEIENLQSQIDAIKKAIEPIVGKSNPLFIKGGSGRPEDEPEVNKWGVYNAYRWMIWKSKLTYMLWEIRTSQKSRRTPDTYRSHRQPDNISLQPSPVSRTSNRNKKSPRQKQGTPRNAKSPSDTTW